MIGPITITGAAGFIGREVVRHARAQQLEIRAMLRTTGSAPPTWETDGGITVTTGDLSKTTTLAKGLNGTQTVIHCAAAMSGDPERDTFVASQNLIDAVVEAKVSHVVLASSISIYDVTQLVDNGELSEATATGIKGRDAYAKSKLVQEGMFRAAAHTHGFTLTILRLGAVWGPTRLFNAHIGPAIGPVLLRLDGGGHVPLCQLTLAAECLLRAALRPDGIQTLNIVDDGLPDRARFMAAFRRCGWPKIVLPLPLVLIRILARITPNSAALPGLLRKPILEARHKPLSYCNALMHKRLGPVTMLPFETAMHQAIEIEQDLTE